MVQQIDAPRTEEATGPLGALPRLIRVPRAEFAADYWDRQALISKADTLPGSFADLLGPAAVDELVSQRGLRTPFLRVASAGNTLGESAFTAGGGVGAGIADQVSDDKLMRLFAEGATIVLQGLHRTWPPLIEFCQQLAADLGHPVQANAYVTPPQNQGFNDHYDVHDVFVMQISGEKRWIIHEPVLRDPLRDQPWGERRDEVAQAAQKPPLIDEVLRPGDCLYLPRGFLHAATALGGTSIHVTVGVHVWTRYALAEQLLQTALRSLATDPEVRASLPLGFTGHDVDMAAQKADLAARLHQALDGVEPQQVADRVTHVHRSQQRAAPIAPLAQLDAIRTLDAATELVLRAHLSPTLEPTADGEAVLRSRAGVVTIGADETDTVTALLDGRSRRAGEIGLDLAERLLRSGVMVPV